MLVLLLSVGLSLLDQVTKHAVRMHFLPGDTVAVVPGLLNWRYVRNTGAAWGILEGLNHWLVLLSVIMLVIMARFRRSFMTDGLLHRGAAGLMIAGIVGNLVDRVRLGYVVDFIDVYWRGHHFPAFNVADSAICTGVGLYILSQFLLDRGRRRTSGV